MKKITNKLKRRHILCLLLVLTLDLLCKSTFAITFNVQTIPTYPLIFIAADNRCTPNSQGGVSCEAQLGMDASTGPIPNSTTGDLYILLPNGNVKKLFPLASHITIVDAPLGTHLVTEPSVSLDGTRVYFSYFHDVRQGVYAPVTTKGADIYMIDLSQLLQNFAFDPANLPVRRLTSQPSNIYQWALNPNRTQGNPSFRSVYNLAPVEMKTADQTWRSDGIKLVFVSSRRQLMNSNFSASAGDLINHNLFIGDLTSNFDLNNVNQFQYYTTTTAQSPIQLRDGIAFSYHSSTSDDRKWEIQQLQSNGVWKPLIGYGWDSEQAWHNGCLLATDGLPQNDLFFATNYYVKNNNGSGPISAIPMSTATQNQMVRGYGPLQLGMFKLTNFVDGDQDTLARFDPVRNRYYGKFSTPGCGAPRDLFAAHTPTSANSKSGHYDVFHNNSHYHFQIVWARIEGDYQSGWDPLDPSHFQVVISADPAWSLIHPKAVIPWTQRTGSPSTPSNDFANTSGLPYSVVGTSAIYNTDVWPTECVLPENANGLNLLWNPSEHNWQSNQSTLWKAATLSWYDSSRPFAEVCDHPLLPQHVFGIAVNITDNKSAGTAYLPGRFEKVETLGVYSVVGQSDTSFKALIPSNVPFEFHLLHRQYGLRIADVRSWHSLKPGESRTDCGGCHNHKPGQGIPFAGTYAQQHNPEDMVNRTPYVRYDASCNPQMALASSPTVHIKKWQEIWPGLVTNCQQCHDPNIGSHSGIGKWAFVYSSGVVQPDYFSAGGQQQDGTYQKLAPYLSDLEGAIASPAWWAARGLRADGRDNTHYVGTLFYFNPAHAAIGLCDGTNPDKAQWVYDFGNWIDNHMPRDYQFPASANDTYEVDTFHPSVNSALVDTTGCTKGPGLNIGAWDNSGLVFQVEVYVNGNPHDIRTGPLPNGLITQTNKVLLATVNDFDEIKVIATDGAGNRQMYTTNVRRLIYDCNGGQNIGNPPYGGQGSLSGGGLQLIGGQNLLLTVSAPHAASEAVQIFASFEGTSPATTLPLNPPLSVNIKNAQPTLLITLDANGTGSISIPTQPVTQTSTLYLQGVISGTRPQTCGATPCTNGIYGLTNNLSLTINPNSPGGGGGGNGGSGGNSGSSGSGLRVAVDKPDIGACQAGSGKTFDLTLLSLMILPMILLYSRRKV